jgi:hypothetical protein
MIGSFTHLNILVVFFIATSAILNSVDGNLDWSEFRSVGGFSCSPLLKNSNWLLKFRQSPQNPSSCNVSSHASYAFFVGEPHTSSTLIGSILDSHPMQFIGNELDAFHYVACGCYTERRELFEAIFRSNNKQWRTGGYSYRIKDSYQGSCPDKKQLMVIGDKKAGMTASLLLSLASSRGTHEVSLFLKQFSLFVKLPLKAIQVVRNPYDTAAHIMLPEDNRCNNAFDDEANVDHCSKVKYTNKYVVGLNQSNVLLSLISRSQKLLDIKADVVSVFGSSVWFEIHAEDFVMDPLHHLANLCNYLQVDCSDNEWQLKVRQSIFKSPHYTSDSYHWCNSLLDVVSYELTKSTACSQCRSVYGRYVKDVKHILFNC